MAKVIPDAATLKSRLFERWSGFDRATVLLSLDGVSAIIDELSVDVPDELADLIKQVGVVDAKEQTDGQT